MKALEGQKKIRLAPPKTPEHTVTSREGTGLPPTSSFPTPGKGGLKNHLTLLHPRTPPPPAQLCTGCGGAGLGRSLCLRLSPAPSLLSERFSKRHHLHDFSWVGLQTPQVPEPPLYTPEALHSQKHAVRPSPRTCCGRCCAHRHQRQAERVLSIALAEHLPGPCEHTT